jgi:PAS domain S-box-containing protein
MTNGSGIGAADEGGLAHRLLDGVGLGLALLDERGDIRLANRAAEDFLGYAPQELAGHGLAELYAPEERQDGAPERVLDAARRDGRVEDEGWRVRRDGSRIRACFVVATIPAPDGPGAGGFTLQLRELSAPPEVEAAALRARLAREEKARARAEEASQARDEFLATLSHELRTPLTAIMGWAHLLRTGTLDEAGQARALETIERNAHLEAQLTADILDVARIITGKLRLQVQSVDAARIVESAVETVQPQAKEKRIDLRLESEEGATTVAADPDRLQQVVGNLLTNAIKFTPAGGEVHVRVVPSAHHVGIEIADTGEGIEREHLPHIFERLRQGGAGTRRKGGLGLGLAIVSHIVELHSGHVTADSEGPGRGSTFVVRLPALAEKPVPAAKAGAEPAGPARLHDLTVLVVDDQEDARELMCAVLGRCGAKVVAVASTAAALAALDRCRPDVLLSDLEMPGEDGYSLIRKVRQRSPEQGGDVPAAALTAYARTEDRLSSLRAGFHRHVPKPVQPDELAEIVASLAAQRR